MSCDQAIFVEQATDTSVSSDAVLLKIDRFGQRFQRRGASAVCHVSSRRDSRSHAASRMITRNTNRMHMIDDHHGPGAGRANLLVRAVDGSLGTHRRLVFGTLAGRAAATS
jgi:hypothetical protein